MKKLIEGIIDFKKKLTPENLNFFGDLALKQKPDALFIACSDSRVVPNLFASTNPGDLFVLRNIGNIIPPVSEDFPDLSTASAIEFSIISLKVSDIIVCGHSECGAMQALTQGIDKLTCPHLKRWLKYGEESLKKAKQDIIVDSTLSEHNLISQINVIQQMKNIANYPLVNDLLAKNQIRIHGMWFEISKAKVFYYEKLLNRFVVIDEEEAQIILKRLE